MDIVTTLRAAGCVFAEDEARLLTAVATGAELERLVARRCHGEPLEHLLGWVEFGGRRLSVGRGVFVPRRRTEFLAELAARALRTGPAETEVLVELCCGVAPVAATAAAARSIAVDIDPAVLPHAHRNAPSTDIRIGDLYQPLPAELRGHIRVIAANAPYVPTARIRTMPAEARDHEPRHTLDGGPDGLDLHRTLADGAAGWLEPGGVLLIETSDRQAAGTANAMRRAGLATTIHTDPARDATVVAGTHPPR